MTPFLAELIRQALRWLGVYLMTAGVLPPELAALVDDAGTTEFVIGAVSYALADGGWLVAKARQFRAWLISRTKDVGFL